MTYQVLAEIRARTKEGEVVIYPGQVITFDPSKAERLVKQGKLMPVSTDASPLSVVVDNRPATKKNPLPPKSKNTRQEIGQPEPVVKVVWSNPHPKGSKAARDFSRKAIEEAREVN